MVEIQILPIKNLPAILTGVLVTLVNVVPRELHFLARQPIKKKQHDDPWNADLQGHRADHFLRRFAGGEISPGFKIVGEEVRIFFVDHLGLTRAEEHKSPAGGADIDRLP